ncbi:ribosomal protein S18 acetylase RimI-like enzyme [Rhodobacter viridis]|uniref:Ribosomal protein S18 acetylase RimI-like enzyme n=1 Tax=Rhodobacter viridis TaxID=1054202 RepID=A0A318TZI0_9RHOB|nr:GNAT family N-acetyltransferase [Rhodobacter viridis]PYF10373.1 ribosomal protein S18 acetylase RimI-like enzyme [Rhodobacter viridis]
MIRPARSEELTVLSEVIGASITALCRADHRDDPERIRPWVASNSPMTLNSILHDPAQRLFVAEPETGIVAVGGIDWRHQPDGQGRIRLLFAAPEAQGKGCGRALLAALEEELRAHGRVEARLTATNTALAFYRSQGWQMDDRGGGGWLLGHPLRKRLI